MSQRYGADVAIPSAAQKQAAQRERSPVTKLDGEWALQRQCADDGDAHERESRAAERDVSRVDVVEAEPLSKKRNRRAAEHGERELSFIERAGGDHWAFPSGLGGSIA